MYWYYPLIAVSPILLLGLGRLAGLVWLMPKKFRGYGWSPICMKEFGVHGLVITGVFAFLALCCYHFRFTEFETWFWLVLLLVPTASDFRLLHKKYNALT